MAYTNPELLWQYFNQITQIPRPSKHEEKIVEFLVSFAKEHNLDYTKDEVGNVVIRKSGTKGYENAEPIVLQSHVDMVCEKLASREINFLTDPIETYIEDNKLKAKGTTLGADNGIGVAIELALLASNDIEHAPLECLFTIDEETGLTGAENIAPGMFSGKTLINLDSEEEGEIYVGCAGGCGSKAYFDIATEQLPSEGWMQLEIKISGLKGGHSGGDIHLGRGNAIKLAARIASKLTESNKFWLSSLTGGNLHNAIPREATIRGAVPFAERENVRIELNVFAAELQDELKHTDPELHIEMQTTDDIKNVLDECLQADLINALICCPHGVLGMSHELPDLVETSVNLASVKEIDGRIVIETSQRSSCESQKRMAQQMVETVFAMANASEVWSGDGYPGWQPNMQSTILKKGVEVYKKLFNEEPKVLAIHAGLECGLFTIKYPGLDMISVGPTMCNVHTPDEYVDIPSVAKFWKFILELIK